MADRRIRDLDDLLRLSDEEREERRLALRAIREARDEMVSVELTAEPLGIDVATVRRWAPDALESTRGGRTYAKDVDTVTRFVPLVVDGELDLVPAEGPTQAALIKEIFDAQYGYVSGWSPASALRSYEGLQLTDGRAVTTDPEVLKRIAIEDPSRFLELYGSL